MTTYRDLFDLSRGQYRLITTAQAAARGVSRSQLQRWRRRGLLESPYRSVYAFPGATDDALARLRAATLAVGDPVWAYGRTAAWVQGLLERHRGPLELLVPHGRRAPQLDGVDVHRTRTWVPGDGATVRRIPVTAPTRTLADLALTWSVAELHPLALDAIQRELTDAEGLLGRADRRLDQRARRILRQVGGLLIPHRADSILEHEVREGLHVVGYRPDPAPLTLVLAGERWTIDVPFADQKLGIECDGLAYHRDARSLERDHRKTNALTLDGWLILRVSWARVHRDWRGFLDQFEAAAASRGLYPSF